MQSSIYQSGEYRRLNESWHEEDADFKFGYVAQLIEGHAIRPRRVLDAGCGSGRGSALIAERFGAEVEGYDVADDTVAQAQSRYGGPRVRFHRGGIADAPCDYDLGVLLDVFEHVDDYIGFLREVRRHARYWIMHVPIDLNVFGALTDGPARARAAFGHLHYFSETSAPAILEYCGFAVRDILYTPGFIQHFRTKRSLRSMPALLPRLALYSVSPRWCTRLLGGVSLMLLVERQTHLAEAARVEG